MGAFAPCSAEDFSGQPNCVGFCQSSGGIAQQLADRPADAGVGLAHTVPAP